VKILEIQVLLLLDFELIDVISFRNGVKLSKKLERFKMSLGQEFPCAGKSKFF